MASCLSEEASSSVALFTHRSRRSARTIGPAPAQGCSTPWGPVPRGLERARPRPAAGGGPGEREEPTTAPTTAPSADSTERTRGSRSSQAQQRSSAQQRPRRASCNGERPVQPRLSQPEAVVRRSSLDLLRWLEEAHSSYTAGLTAADVEAASSSPDSPHMTCHGGATDLLDLCQPGRSSRRLSSDGSEKCSTKRDPALEAALQLRRERRGQRRLDRLVRRMSLLDRRNSVSDGSLDWLTPDDLLVNPPVEGEDEPLALSAPGRMLPDAVAQRDLLLSPQ